MVRGRRQAARSRERRAACGAFGEGELTTGPWSDQSAIKLTVALQSEKPSALSVRNRKW